MEGWMRPIKTDTLWVFWTVSKVDFMKCAAFRLLLAGLGLAASPAASSRWEVGMMSETIFFISSVLVYAGVPHVDIFLASSCPF